MESKIKMVQEMVNNGYHLFGETVEEFANTALYLASDLSSYVTGQVIAVNGGLYC